jgi:hypothetical protein
MCRGTWHGALVDPLEAAEAWVQEQLLLARNVPWGDPDVRYGSLREFEESLRLQTAAFLQPTHEYLGLSLTEASNVADVRHDHLCRHPTAGHRMYLSPKRVHVLVEDGRVVAARRDWPAWLHAARPDPEW